MRCWIFMKLALVEAVRACVEERQDGKRAAFENERVGASRAMIAQTSGDSFSSVLNSRRPSARNWSVVALLRQPVDVGSVSKLLRSCLFPSQLTQVNQGRKIVSAK